MERFPEAFVSHNLPLLLLSGLGADGDLDADPAGRSRTFLHEGGFRIHTDWPPLRGPQAEALLQAFRDHDASRLTWHAQATAATVSRAFKIQAVGRTYTLPPRKALPPPHIHGAASPVDATPLTLHSPLSPLTPSSPLFPDGLISPLWVTKHQARLPSILVVFFTLGSDPNTNSLQDNKVKSEIGAVRSALVSTSYKTKLVVVMVADGPVDPSDAEERCATIRRAAGLDAKSVHCLAHTPTPTPTELHGFVRSLLTILHPASVDYYRDLSKHARRKRNRSTVPPPTVPPGTAHVLSLQGWNMRYEFKLGVFAEFRQEMDAACRNYEAAYEALFAPEIIESIAAWSPRFNDARLIADTIAIRAIRCLLWTDQGTVAVTFWTAHRERIRGLVNRKGKGTENYGWEAWQTAWTKVMADLLARSAYPALRLPLAEAADRLPIFARPAASPAAAERVVPWAHVHHEGYWLDNASQCTAARRRWARQIPEEDRQSPGRSPASVVASKSDLYDTYLALEPYREVPLDGRVGFDYLDEIVSTLTSATLAFQKRGQFRKIDQLTLRRAHEYAEAGNRALAVATMKEIWLSRSLRREGWWQLLQHVGWTLWEWARHDRDVDLLLRLVWELSNTVFARKPGSSYNLRQLHLGGAGDRPRPTINLDESLSPLTPSFAFQNQAVFVGEPLECQLVVQSHAHMGDDAPIRLDEIQIFFDGHLKPVILVDDASASPALESPTSRLVRIRLEDSPADGATPTSPARSTVLGSQRSTVDLSFAPGSSQVFQFHVIPREAEELAVGSVVLVMKDDAFTLTARSSDGACSRAHWWETRNGTPVPRAMGQDRASNGAVTVQPKPPKLRIETLGLQRAYYINETITLDVAVINEEDEDATVVVEAHLVAPEGDSISMWWDEPDSASASERKSATGTTTLPPKDLGTVAPAGTSGCRLVLADAVVAADLEVAIVATYRLASDPETTRQKRRVVAVGVIRPFEANYEFTPRMDADPWPNFFDLDPFEDSRSRPRGLTHHYAVSASLHSFAPDVMVVEAMVLTADNIVGGATCSSSAGILRTPHAPGPADSISSELPPDQTRIFDFELAIQKMVHGDQRPVGVDLALEIGWRRQGSDVVHATVLEAPRLVAAMAEPRVMLSVAEMAVPSPPGTAYRLEFMIENPSMHFLTFNASMEAHEHFAFSGPKTCTLSLVPLSRHALTYRILPNKKDTWIEVRLNVVDAYFGQTLKVFPVGERVRSDKKGTVSIKV